MENPILDWKLKSETECLQTRVFRILSRRMSSPDGRFEDDFYVLDTVDWVNIVAMTPEGQFILVRQYRFGIMGQSLEVPGGMIDPGEDPLQAAQRELLEETGYVSDVWRALFVTTPNPALNTNRCSVYLATHCKLHEKAGGDDYEYIETELLEPDEYFERLKNGQIHHALTVAAISTALLQVNR